MEHFSDTVFNKLDAKGRVSVPAKFRQVLAGQGAEFVVLTRSLKLTALDGFGPNLRHEITSRLEPLNPFSDEFDAIAATYFAGSAELAWDQDGRITLPEHFIAHAQLTDQVVFVGMGRKFQVWAPQAYEQRFAELRRLARESGTLLSAPLKGAP